MKEITSVHNARSASAELQKPRARQGKRPFVCESAPLVAKRRAAARSGALYRKRGARRNTPDDRAGGRSGLRAVRRFNGGDAGGHTAKTPQGVVCTAGLPSRRRRCGAAARRARRGGGPRATSARFLHGGCGGLTARSRPGWCGSLRRKDAEGDDGQCVPRAGAADERFCRDAGSDEARGLCRCGD